MVELSQGAIWKTLSTLIPLIVVFIQGTGESGLVDASIAAAMVIVLNAIVRVLEVLRKAADAPPGVAASPSPYKQRGKIARILIGG